MSVVWLVGGPHLPVVWLMWGSGRRPFDSPLSDIRLLKLPVIGRRKEARQRTIRAIGSFFQAVVFADLHQQRVKFVVALRKFSPVSS